MNSAWLKIEVVGTFVLVLLVSGATWKVQDWRYGKQVAEQDRLHNNDLSAIGNAANAQQRSDRDKRLALEQRLSASEQTHYMELSDVQINQARLRDRLATSDLRLSVLLDATNTSRDCSVPTVTGTGGMVHGGARARLDPAHAQRVIGITDAGDRGLIALKACQDYVRQIGR